MANLGKYTLLRKLAAGGMAEVFLARIDGPAGFSKTQVVKRILPHLADNDEFVSMFLNEARLAALLNHPNIIQIFELGQEGGTYFIAMELVDGPHLRAVARAAHSQGEHLPLNEVLKIISLACEGLAYAHDFVDESGRALHLVHRDISPDNLLLSRQGAVKVADFGIAKAANLPNMTRTGILKGKINYMPPEQLRAIPLDKRADVFALGVVLHEALASTKPFDSSSDVSAMQAILNEAPRRLDEMRPDLPGEVQVIIDKALAKDRDQRYPDCHALQADIDALLLKRQAAVRAADIAALVNRFVPPAARSDPNLPALNLGEKVGTPPGGAAPESVAFELSAGQILSLEPGASSKAETRPGPPPPPVMLETRTGPKPVPVLAEPSPLPPPTPPPRLPPPVPTSVTVSKPGAVVELQGGRPPERPRSSQTSAPLIGVVVVGAALAAGGVWWHQTQSSRPPIADPVSAPTAPVAVVTPPPKPVAPPQVVAAVVAPPPAPPPAAPVSPPPVVPSAAPESAPSEPPSSRTWHSHARVAPRPVVAAEAPSPTPAAPTPAVAPPPAAPEAVAPVVAATKVMIRRDAADLGPSSGPKTSSDQPGTLVLRVAPWAEVEVDGTTYGVTPMAPIKLLAGSHTVHLKNAQIHADRTMKVDIQGGSPSTLRVNLALPP